MGSTKEEQERVKNLLLDTVTLLCKNGLNFKQQLKVQGLLGITLDDESVFIVHIDEKVGEAIVEKKDQEESSDQSSIDSRRSSRDSQFTPNKNRKRQADSSPVFRGPPDKVRVKMEKEEPNEDLILIDNNVDDKSMIKAQIYQQQQSNMPSISHIQGGFPHFNPQNTGQKPPGPFVAGNAQHGLSQINTPGGTPEKFQQWGLYMPTNLRRSKSAAVKDFVCDHPKCNRNYYDKGNLRRHYKEKHGGVSYKEKQKIRDNEVSHPHEMENADDINKSMDVRPEIRNMSNTAEQVQDNVKEEIEQNLSDSEADVDKCTIDDPGLNPVEIGFQCGDDEVNVQNVHDPELEK